MVERYVEQVQCAEKIAVDVVDAAGESSIVLLTGDHGIASGIEGTAISGGQVADALFERLNVFMAYRMPEGCTPAYLWTVAVLEAILSCATDSDSIIRTPEFSVFTEVRGRDWPKLERIQDEDQKRLISSTEALDDRRVLHAP